ncbi:hypothetical protein CBS63078_5855 [Aspergillus niger]|nr:hypothetical protein CBS115989_6925 [Aspergillus niger]KAI2850098.1 hypothetical protein CBS11232_6370 [Aspergillus niger]KAI2862970.1 hypothetical protein CBS12448_4383 [Aspergillus niger]KAI2873375.1 hypothetical protein CBS115988_7103 [Aspergillus niger]KAI2894411.1 hypothetical protein CBS11852_4905 [Aspergillus niger]
MLISLSTFVSLAALVATTTASTSCMGSISHDTIAFFSGAALTFGSNYTDASDCSLKCSTIPACRTWLFTSGGQCELFRHSPVATAANPNFSYGVCRQGNDSSLDAWLSHAASSSHPIQSPTISLSAARITPSNPAIKRHLDSHRHGSHHKHRGNKWWRVSSYWYLGRMEMSGGHP